MATSNTKLQPSPPSNTTEFQQMNWESQVMDATQTHEFISNMDQLEIGEKFSVGDNNVIADDGSAALGDQNVVGAMGYRILNRVYDGTNNTTLATVDGEIDPLVDTYKPIYSFTSMMATLNAGKVLEVDLENHTLLLEGNLAGFMSDSILYFADYPTIGNVKVNSNMCMATGYKNKVTGYTSTASGGYCVAGCNYAHAEGKECVASWGCHAEGAQNEALRECSHVEGRFNINKGIVSHARGGANNIANGCRQSEVGGYLARAEHSLAYVWNGATRYGYQGDMNAPYSEIMQYALPNTTIPSSQVEDRVVEYMHSQLVLEHMYKSHGKGTYNINPENGIEGFYIGEKTLLQHIQENAPSGTPLAGKTYSKSNTPINTILYDIAEALGAKITA